MNFLARLILGPFIKLAANCWCAWQDVKERQPAADPPGGEPEWTSCRLNADPHYCPDRGCTGVLAGSDLIDRQVPQGTGERFVHDFHAWLDKENAS